MRTDNPAKTFVGKLQDRLSEVDGLLSKHEKQSKHFSADIHKAVGQQIVKIRDQKENLTLLVEKLKRSNPGARRELSAEAMKIFMAMKESFRTAREYAKEARKDI